MPDEIKAEFGRNLKNARKAAEEREGRRLSYDTLVAEMVATFGPRYVPTPQAVGDWHRGKVSPEGVRLEWVEWLAERYGVPLSALSPVFKDRIGPARELLSRSRWSRGQLYEVDPIDGQMKLSLDISDPNLAIAG